MSEKLPTLAVVIANYNYARFLPDAMDSVLAQQPPFAEIIVVDDGSTDDSVQVLEAYQRRVRIILQENSGQIAACVAGMQASTCDYVYFLDADDYVAPNFTARLLPHLTSHPVKVQFQLEGVDGDKQPLGSIFPSFPDGYDSDRMRIDNKQIGFYQCPPTSGNVFHRDTFNSLKLDETPDPPHIDASGPLLMPYLGDVVTVPQRLAFYRVHGTNIACSDWSRPTAETLFAELGVVRRTWNTALSRLGDERPAFGDRDPLYVLEP
jgi:glycosyltransferase involved in cell wall biosynthesis